ncbi:hypothetical protein, partial [Novipirellula herctigrandis]|uniref:hypothetical protein n=1 Tax=Novipirellula herctigrandis TaxID=2527986 RepID=UPI003AF37053
MASNLYGSRRACEQNSLFSKPFRCSIHGSLDHCFWCESPPLHAEQDQTNRKIYLTGPGERRGERRKKERKEGGKQEESRNKAGTKQEQSRNKAGTKQEQSRNKKERAIQTLLRKRKRRSHPNSIALQKEGAIQTLLPYCLGFARILAHQVLSR